MGDVMHNFLLIPLFVFSLLAFASQDESCKWACNQECRYQYYDCMNGGSYTPSQCSALRAVCDSGCRGNVPARSNQCYAGCKRECKANYDDCLKDGYHTPGECGALKANCESGCSY